MRFYVYEHFHPETGEIVYVGKGTAGRAWSCGTSTAAPGLRGNRSAEHQFWIMELLKQGYTPADFVRIVAQSLSDSNARALETELVEAYGYDQLFNLQAGLALMKVNAESLQIGLEARNRGDSWLAAAKQAGISTMTLWRAANGKTKGINYAHQ